MKVCFVSFEYPPFIDGGAGVYAKELTNSLTRLGCEIHIITRTSQKRITYSYEKGIHVHRLPFINFSGFLFLSFSVSLMSFFRTLVRRMGSIDILHSNDYSFFPFRRSFDCIPKVTTIHHLFYSNPKLDDRRWYSRFRELTSDFGFILPFIQKKVILASDVVIAVSKSTRRAILERLVLNPSQVITIYNGYGTSAQRYSSSILEQELKLVKYLEEIKNVGRNLILYVGRIDDPRKNLSLLLRAVERVIKYYKIEASLLLVGKGDPSGVLRLAKRLGIEGRTHLTGYVSDACLRAFYSLCDVFVLPSLQEGFGLTLLEAMSYGKPVIATRVGGTVEFLKQGKTGYLVEVGELETLAASIFNILADKENAKKFGSYNQTYVQEHFSWEKCAKETFALYERLS